MISFKKRTPKKKLNKIEGNTEKVSLKPPVASKPSKRKICLEDFCILAKFGEGSYSEVFAAV